MDREYIDWIQELKQRIRSSQIKAGLAVNTEMISLYWSIGKDIAEKQNSFGWGSKIVEQMSNDLKRELPDTKGFSRSNLFAMQRFYSFYKDSEFVYQAGGQIQNEPESEEDSIVYQPGKQLSKESILCKICPQFRN